MAFGQPVLIGLCVDLQIHICEFLNSAEIVSLRQTCKTFHELTSERTIWIQALIRVCRENLLFFPTFPISDMSVADLERAATAPFRWIALSSSEARDSDGCLPCRTRILPVELKAPGWRWSGRLYLVPGGRYLVRNGPNSVNVRDLGYPSVSSSKKPIKMWMWTATVGYIDRFLVHPTPDGLGIRILGYSSSPSPQTAFYILEIYPQRETPELVKIAELILNLQEQREDISCSLHGNRVVIFYPNSMGTVMVWDFIANAGASWSTQVGHLWGCVDIIKVTESTVCLGYCGYALVFQIPPLATKKPLFDMGDCPELAPVLTFALPGSPSSWFQKLDEWYCDDLGFPLCIDIFHRNSLGRSITDFSRLPVISLLMQREVAEHSSSAYRICGNRFITCFNLSECMGMMVEAHTTSSGFGLSSDCHESGRPVTEHVSFRPLVNASMGFAFCPASGRLVNVTLGKILICDFL